MLYHIIFTCTLRGINTTGTVYLVDRDPNLSKEILAERIQLRYKGVSKLDCSDTKVTEFKLYEYKA